MKSAGKILAVAMTELFGMVERRSATSFSVSTGLVRVVLRFLAVTRTHSIRDSAGGIPKRNESALHVWEHDETGDSYGSGCGGSFSCFKVIGV